MFDDLKVDLLKTHDLDYEVVITDVHCSKRSSSLREMDPFPLGRYSHHWETDVCFCNQWPLLLLEKQETLVTNIFLFTKILKLHILQTIMTIILQIINPLLHKYLF